MYYNPLLFYFLLSSSLLCVTTLPMVRLLERQESSDAEDVFMLTADLPDNPLAPVTFPRYPPPPPPKDPNSPPKWRPNPPYEVPNMWPEKCDYEQIDRRPTGSKADCIHHCNMETGKKCNFAAFGKDASGDNTCYTYHFFQGRCFLKQCGTGGECKKDWSMTLMYFDEKDFVSLGAGVLITGDPLLLDGKPRCAELQTLIECKAACSLNWDCNAFAFDAAAVAPDARCTVFNKKTPVGISTKTCASCVSYMTTELQALAWSPPHVHPAPPFEYIGPFVTFQCLNSYADLYAFNGKTSTLQLNNVKTDKECADHCSVTLRNRCIYAILREGLCTPLFDPDLMCEIKRSGVNGNGGHRLLFPGVKELVELADVDFNKGYEIDIVTIHGTGPKVNRGTGAFSKDECRKLCVLQPACNTATWKENELGFPISCVLRRRHPDVHILNLRGIPCVVPPGGRCASFVKPDLVLISKLFTKQYD